MRKVLFVDDERDIRAVAGLALGAVGRLEVETVATGEEALTAARRGRPDVILLDLVMPGIDGAETFLALRADEATKKIPVIFVTGKVQRTEIERLRKLGALGVIEKPFDPMTLADQVRELVERAGVRT